MDPKVFHPLFICGEELHLLQSSVTNVAVEQWNTANGAMCDSAQPISQTQLIVLARVVSSVYREDLAGQRKCCTNTWFISSRQSNYWHRYCYMGTPFGEQDGRINRNKAASLSNAALSYESAQWPWMREEQHWGKGNPAITASATVAPASCSLLFYSPVLVSAYFRCLLGWAGLLAACICTTACIGNMPLYKQVGWVYTLLILCKGTVGIVESLSFVPLSIPAGQTALFSFLTSFLKPKLMLECNDPGFWLRDTFFMWNSIFSLTPQEPENEDCYFRPQIQF